MTNTANQLYQWMTEEMSFLPFNRNGKDKVPLSPADLEFLVQGEGEKLWKYVENFVHSRKKVEKIRKSILLQRFRDAGKFHFSKENDPVGKQLKSSLELRKLRTAIEEKRRTIENIKEKCKQVNSSHKLAEYKLQFSKSQLDDIERRILLLNYARNTTASKVQICQSSNKFFDRFKSETDKGVDSSFNTSFMGTNDSISSSMLSFRVSNVDSDLGSKARCQNFISKCTALAKDMVDVQSKEIILQRPPKNLHWGSFSLMSHSCLHSTPNVVNDHASSKFDAKKLELRKFVSANMLQLQPQLLHELLLRLTSRGIANLAACASKDGLKDSLRFLGTKSDDATALKSQLEKKFMDLYYETACNMIAALKERKVASKAEQNLKSLMAVVERELKEIFTVQTAMVGKAYELVKVEAEMASLRGISTYKEEFIKEKDSEVANHSSDLIELHLPDEKKLKGSLEKLKAFRESILRITLRNYSEFHMVMESMRKPGFLGGLQSFFVERGLINQEIMAFTDYPLEYHVKTNVCGKFVPDFQLLSNSSCMQNIRCFGASGIDDSFFESCIKASLGRLPHSSSEGVLFAAFNLKLYSSEFDDKNVPASFIDDQILQSLLSRTQDLSVKLKEKEESLENEITYSTDIVKSYCEETNRILNETEFLFTNWKKNAVNKCVPENVVFEGKSYHQWHLEFLAALYKLKNKSREIHLSED